MRDNTRSIAGYTPDDTKILISTKFDPTNPVLGQFMEYSIGNTLEGMFQTLAPEGFENTTQIFIASSGDVNFDNITLVSIPEGNYVLGLLALGTVGVLSKIKINSNRES